MEQILSTITTFIIHTISALGYPGVGLLMAIESAAIPLPSEIIMPFSGFLVFVGRFNLWGIALAGAFGSVVGSWVTYWIGKYGGLPLVRRYGRYVLITEHDLAAVHKFFEKFGAWATFLGRLLPIVRTYISLPAGIAEEPFWPFTFACFIGSFLWSALLGWVGLKLGANWASLHAVFRSLDVLVVLLLIVIIAWWIRRHLKHRIRD